MTRFHPAFRHIHLELAREGSHPEGANSHGYDILAPLTEDGHLDAEVWREHRDVCRVRRFRDDEEDMIGKLRHGPGKRWYFDYDPERDDDDETGFRFEDERFVPGEYVGLSDADGAMHTYRVVSVRPLD